MNKLPTKQIYLLIIIIVGIIALSVYSTYAIFTIESETSDVVSLHTPNSLEVSTDMYEYKQVTVPKNDIITTDIDIYNTYEYELCYSIWYKTATKEADGNKIKVYQNTDTTITSNSIIESMNSKRITLIITNDNDMDVKVNIGLSSSKNEGTCELNISKDKSIIKSVLNNPKKLSEIIIENSDKPQENETGYLIYKNEKEIIDLDEPVYISEKFTYKDELFTLKDAKLIELEDLLEYQSTELKEYYTCFTSSECQFLYKINEITKETEKDELTKEEINYYSLTNFDRYIGYHKGISGIKKLTEDNIDSYIYYGDNPNNFIYYNCTNEQDIKTCELWRIIGITKDEEDNYITKIIRNETIGKYQYTDKSNNLWEESTLNEYLNKDYELNNDSILKEITYNQENILDVKTKLNTVSTIPVDTEKTSKVFIMSLSDYLKASTCQDKNINEYNETCLNNNWLNRNNGYEWTMSIKNYEPTVDVETGETITPLNNTIYTVSSTLEETLMTESRDVRPVVYLKSRMLLASGTGTLEDPYIIK